jgi:hypothetical protein
MKAKAKPTKGSARVKKFDRGGTIGALAGLGTLAYLMSRNKDKDSDNKGSGASTDKPILSKAIKDAQSASNSSDTPGSGGRAGTIIPEPGRKLSIESETDNERAANIEGNPEQSKVYKAEPGQGYAKPVKPIVAAKRKPIVKAKPMESSGIRDITNSPRISDMKKVRDLANKASNSAEERKAIVEKQEQARLSEMAKRGVVPEKELRTSRTRLGAVRGTANRASDEFMKRDMMLRNDAEARGQGDKYDAMKKGGKVKKMADGGIATAKPELKKPAPKKDTMPDWAKTDRENKAKDDLNKREAAGADKEVKRNMSTFGLKKGGATKVKKYASGGSVSASKRADGIAQRGKTRGKMY